MWIRCIVLFCFVFGAFVTGISQISIDSLFRYTKKVETEEVSDSFLMVAQDTVRLRHEQNDWSGAKKILKLITKLPYDTTRVEKFSAFIEEERELLKSRNPIWAANLISYIGTWSARNDKYEQAIVYFKKSADELHAVNDTQHLHNVYYWLAQTVQFGRSNGPEVLIYAEQAERVNALKKKKDVRFEGKIHYLRGLAYQELNNEKAIYYFRKSKELNGDSYGLLENFITKSLLRLGRYEEAYVSAKKASELFIARYGEESGLFLMYEAIAQNRLGKSVLALETIESSIYHTSRYYSPYGIENIKAHYYKAIILIRNNRFDEAIEACQKVYEFSIPTYKPASENDIPDISDITANNWVVDALKEHGKALVKKYDKTKDARYLKLALNINRKNIRDIEIRRGQMENWDSKNQYNTYLYNVYENSVIASALLYQSDPSSENKSQVLFFLEKSKAILLQENDRKRNKRKNIPAEVLEEENIFIQSIADLKTRSLKVQAEGDSSKLSVLKNEIFDLRRSLEDFKQKHIAYYSTSNVDSDATSPIERIQTLPDGVAVFGYHLSEDIIVSIVFDNEEFHVDLSPRSVKFNDNVLKIRQNLSDWNSTLSNRKVSEDSIKIYAQHLSSQLFKHVDGFTKKPRQLIIMPDKTLHNIPFELLTIPGEDQIVLHQYDLSYAYLFSSFPSIHEKEKQPVSFAGFAPIYHKEVEETEGTKKEDTHWISLRSGLIDIPEARKSLVKLANRYNGSSWLGDKATKANFIREAKNYDVLHLGMHSLLNEDASSLSSLVFYGKEDHELYLNEIQSMEIPAKLVVLSACNTGVGRNLVGEGPFSLARAFFYAGAESALMSLWQVPDEQTSRMMQLFYSNLETGVDKSKALAQAKRDYLKTASVLESHPAFWSGFVLVGDTSALILEPSGGWFFENSIYLLIAFFLGVLLWAVLRKRMTGPSS